MSSAPITPYPRRRRSFAGPIVLILFGVVALLGNFHLLTWYSIMTWFARYWPLLLILWGVIKLIEHLHARSTGETPSGIGVSGCFLVFLIIMLGLGSRGLSGLNWGALRDNIDLSDNFGDGPWQIFGNNYTYAKQLDQPLPSNGSVKFAVERGTIKVSPSPDDKVHVSVHKRVIAGSQGESDKIDQETQPHITIPPIPPVPTPPLPVPPNANATPEEMKQALKAQAQAMKEAAKAQADAARSQVEAARSQAEAIKSQVEALKSQMIVDATHSGDGFVEVDMDVEVPRSASVELSTQHGDLEVDGRDGDLRLTSAHGDIKIEDIKGNVTADMQHGDFSARNVTGDVKLQGNISDTTIVQVSGKVTLSGDFFGDTDIEQVAQTVRFNSSRTDMEVGALPGNLKMDSDSLNVSSANGGFKIHTRSKEIHLEDVAGNVEVDNSNGDVELHQGHLPVGQININNHHGGIRLYLPSQAAVQLQASSKGGDIESDFNEFKVESRNDASTAAGALGSNGREVQLNADHGDIEIRKGGLSSSNDATPAPNSDSTAMHAPATPRAPKAHKAPEAQPAPARSNSTLM